MSTNFPTRLIIPYWMLLVTSATVFAQGTVFTYQGRVTVGGTNFIGTGLFKFALVTGSSAGYTTHWSNDGTSSAGSEPSTSVSLSVNAGLFAVALGNSANMTPIDAAIFPQPGLKLRIWFNDGVHGFAALDPPQDLTPAPYAIFARSADAAGLTGVIPAASFVGSYSNAVMLTNPVNEFAGNGTGLTNVNAGKLGGYSATDFWKLGGNNVVAGQFLGSTNNQPVELWAGSTRALRLEAMPNDANHSNIVNLVGGSSVNSIAPGVYGSVIIGGGAANYAGGMLPNTVETGAHFSLIGGGWGNSLQANAYGSLVLGGVDNLVEAEADLSSLLGGSENSIKMDADYCFLGGGRFNNIGTNSDVAFLGGGIGNSIQADSGGSFLGGGSSNSILTGAGGSFLGAGDLNTILPNAYESFIGGGSSNTNGGVYSTVPGGRENYAAGQYCLAAGYNAKAANDGAFVWSDGTGTTTTSTTNNQFVTRASGGYLLYSSTGSSGVSLAPGSGAWTSLSDRNAKENFVPVDTETVLARVATLPLNSWNYKSQPACVRHMGPTAQDFKSAFGVGETDTGISTVDGDGVALAAIQGLNQKLAKELERRDIEIDELKARLNLLEKVIAQHKLAP